MALKGLSMPYCAEYSYDEKSNTVTYENGYACDKAISYGVSVESGDDTPLYGNNGIAENYRESFASGDLTLGTTDLPNGLSRKILGLKKITKSYGEGKTVEINVYDDDQKSPYLGFGIIELHQVNDVDQYRAVVLCKIKFNINEESAKTKGESIEWTTPEITAKISRSDETAEDEKGMRHPWKYDAWFGSEAEADEFLKSVLNVTEIEEVA